MNEHPPAVVVGETSGTGLAEGDRESGDGAASRESVEQPAKVMRVGSMIKQLLEEVRQSPLDPVSRQRMKEIYESSIRELADGLSPDLVSELDRLALPFSSDEPSDSEIRLAQAQLVGWLEGLFHGIQATLFAQQMAARAQLEEMRRQSLPAGTTQAVQDRPGPYL
ncbi:MAG: peptidylprolyl isomerase [Acidimicrobiaceae bacterium]|jgi:hypothetical protein|nr:peptidylprolyl isomerase [Acidimicrobiaceae bacterium]